MKKAVSLLLSLFLLLGASACGQSTLTASSPSSAGSTGILTVAATTYPVYCFASAVTSGVEGVQVRQVITDSISCLHDYTLTVSNMKILEGAQVIALSGAGLEDFMHDALAGLPSTTAIIDCSENVDLLTTQEDGETIKDPHIWLDPDRAAQMVRSLADGLAQADPAHAAAYRSNAEAYCAQLSQHAETWRAELSDLSCRELITFHDGFQYFAQAFHLTILKSIEEEPGSEASAQDIEEVVQLIQTHHIPAIFAEANSSDATAQAISRETGVRVGVLSTLMSIPEDWNTTGYLNLMDHNVRTVAEELGA